MHKADQVYREPRDCVGGFVFDEQVSAVFPDMIRRSVPGYASTLSMIGLLAQKYVTANSHVYDLGCSLGAATLAIRQHILERPAHIVAIDNAPAMLKRCAEIIGDSSAQPHVELRCESIQDTHIENASMVILNFTLQFLPIQERLPLLQKIHAGMQSGGVLVLSEKIAHPDPQTQQLMIELHHAFKRSQGYSDLEIAQKRTALENVLIPETLHTHKERLASARFSRVEVWFQCLNFASWVAFKD